MFHKAQKTNPKSLVETTERCIYAGKKKNQFKKLVYIFLEDTAPLFSTVLMLAMYLLK